MTDHQTVVFVHVPKTAGTSLRNMLSEARLRVDPEPWNISDRRELPDIGWEFTRHLARMRRSTVGLVMGHMPHSAGALFQNPFYITVLRDPVERLLSSYSHMQREREAFAAEMTAVHVDSIESFAWHPAFTNHQLQYFLDYDFRNSTTFMTSILRANAPDSSYLGVSFGERRRVELRNIRLIQRRLGPAHFKVQLSHDEFRTHVVDVPSYAVTSDINRNIDIAIPPNMGGTSWRIVPLVDADAFNWYVISMELWEMVDGVLTLVAGGLYDPVGSVPRTTPRVTRVWPAEAKVLSGGHTDNLLPEYAFDGRNALSLYDLDGTTMREDRLDVAKSNLAKFGAIGVVGDMTAFARLVEKKTGYTGLEVRYDNANDDPSVYGKYDPAVIARVRELNRLDVEFYEYARELSRAQMISEGIPFNEAAYRGTSPG